MASRNPRKLGLRSPIVCASTFLAISSETTNLCGGAATLSNHEAFRSFSAIFRIEGFAAGRDADFNDRNAFLFQMSQEVRQGASLGFSGGDDHNGLGHVL